MKRLVEPEWLDELPPDDPRAMRSRGDLRRLNRLMRHAPMFCASFKAGFRKPPARLIEIGAGDGSLMLEVARQLHACWPGVRVLLVDRKKTVSDATLAGFQHFGWTAEVVVADVFEALAAQNAAEAILANLFLHHFADEQLAEMLQLIAARTKLFIALETRRTWPSFAVSRLLSLIGCNTVTRHDAVVSMRAGFRCEELSALWPRDDEWQLEERPAVLFTHLFVAKRRS